jgi:hypothetical protein
VGDQNKQLGKGHLFKSKDGGKTFKNVSGNLPDSPANWVALRGKQLLVATDVGVFGSGPRGSKQKKPKFGRLKGLPNAPATSISLKPNNPNVAVASMFGRGVWTFSFKKKLRVPAPSGAPSAPQLASILRSYNFEPDAQGWTAASTGTPPGSFSRQTPGHGIGPATNAAGHEFAITGPGGYTDTMDATLTSPPITVPAGGAVVQWYMRLDTESFDPLKVEWSKNGTDWTQLGSYAGQNAGAPGWSKYIVGLQAPGGPIRVRFHFTSDDFCSGLPSGGPLCEDTDGYDGVHLDDVVVGTAR